MKVLLAVDGSDASMSAVAAIAALPTPPGSEIRVVTVVPDTFAPEGSPWPNVVRVDPPADRDRILDGVAQRLLDVADRLRVGDRRVSVHVLEGRPATEIVRDAERWSADLVVVGARGLSTVRRLLIGSVSSEVVDHAPCPVLVARHAAIKRILLATDGSPAATSAAEFIAESGLFAQAEIRVVSASDPGMAWWAGVSPVDGATSIEVYADAVEMAAHRAQEAVDRTAHQLAGLDVQGAKALRDGDVVGTILDEAEAWHADVIVLGARNMGTLHRWLVGSVSRSVLHLANASVLIVRPKLVATDTREAVAATTA
jgi:nucleotide-binding universal stress UspA family protein